MKIACIGKGGSGKTTICALLARAAAASGQPVVAYDADVNQHLGMALGIPIVDVAQMALIGHDQIPIKRYLRGTNTRIASDAHMFKTSPPGTGSQLINVANSNPIYERFSYVHQGVRLLRVGPMDSSDVGVKCFHGKNGIVEMLLGHTIDTQEDRVLVDVTAGTDSLASGLFAKVHALVLAVEPTIHSTAVYRQIAELAAAHDMPLLLVANKIEGADDIAFIKTQTGVDPVVSIPRSAALRRLERGEQVAWEELEPEVQEAALTLNTRIGEIPIDWASYQERGYQLHRENAQSWINNQHDTQAESQIDETFSLPDIAHTPTPE